MSNLKLSSRSLAAVEKLITGDVPNGETAAFVPYMTGPKLVAFFNEFGADDSYSMSGGFPSRWVYVQEKLKSFNGTPALQQIIEMALSPSRFLDSPLELEPALVFLNKYLEYEDLEIAREGRRCRLRKIGDVSVESESSLPVVDPVSHEFIREQTQKCDQKVAAGDYDGAITNARSLVEAVLYEIEGRLDANQIQYDGNLPKLYKRVQKLLNIDSDRNDISDNLKSILRGLASVISGIAPLRNQMGDAHVRTHKPERHHAKLAVNSAKTLTDFLIDSFEYQSRTGRLQK